MSVFHEKSKQKNTNIFPFKESVNFETIHLEWSTKFNWYQKESLKESSMIERSKFTQNYSQ